MPRKTVGYLASASDKCSWKEGCVVGDETAVSGLERFEQLVVLLGEPFTKASLSYHAVRNDSRLVIRHARLILQAWSTEVPQKFVRFLNQEVGFLPLSGLGLGTVEIVERFSRGELLETPHGQFQFPLAQDTTAQIHFHPLHELELPNSRRLAILTMVGAQLPHPRFSSELDWSLKANNPPYGTLGELLMEFRLGGYGGDFACLEVSMPNIAEVDLGSHVSGQTAEPGVILPLGVDKTPVSLGVVVRHQGATVERLVLQGAQLTWSEREIPTMPMHQHGRGSIQIPTGAVIQCFAVYNGIAQHEAWIGDPGSFPNWKRTTYEWADPGCEVLKDLLFEKIKKRKKEGGDFEVGVASLLWMLGFGVLQIRSPRLLDNPDLLMTTPGGRIVLVECTTGVIDKEDKLAKLHDRARSLKGQLEKAGSGHIELLPVLVTSLPAASVVDIEKATKFGIQVLTKEGLQSALDRSIIPQDPDALFKEQEQVLLALQSQLGEGKP
jgi:hypothetical protein